MRHPRQACHHHAQGHPACPPYPWRACLSCRHILPYEPTGLFQGHQPNHKEIFLLLLIVPDTQSKIALVKIIYKWVHCHKIFKHSNWISRSTVFEVRKTPQHMKESNNTFANLLDYLIKFLLILLQIFSSPVGYSSFPL